MLLAIDTGNTHTVIGVYDGTEMRASWRAATERQRTADEWGALLTAYLAARGLEIHDIHATIVSSVVPPVTSALRHMCSRWLGHQVLLVEPGLKTGVRLAVDNPREVGADRIVNTVAAFRRYGG